MNMRDQGNIKALMGVVVIWMTLSCVKSEIDYGPSDKEVSVVPVTSMVSKSIPGAIMGNTYPFGETMGILAFHNEKAEPDVPWEKEATVEPYVYYKNEDGSDLTDGENPLKNMPAEFGYRDSKGAWGGIFSTLSQDKKSTSKEEQPHTWPEDGSLIFAGISPYYKFHAIDPEHPTMDGSLRPLNNMVTFDVATRTLKITNYSVGQYIPMSAEQIEDPDHEYVNKSQSDLMFFMPHVQDGKYVGVNKLSAYPALFRHALSLVEFTVRAEDDFDVYNLDIDRIALEEVYHTGDFSATVNDDGSVTASWDNLEGQEAVNVFGTKDDTATDLHLDMQPRSVAQLLIIPGPTHRIKVVCHVYTMDKYYEQTYIIEPEDVGIDKWEMGKRYVYNLVLGLNKIEYAPETYDWNDVDGGV